jgi:hypothetical protein
VGIVATLTAVGWLAFVGISVPDGTTPPGPLLYRLAVPALMMSAGLFLVGLIALISPCEVRASPEGITLRTRLGVQTRIPRERILGVRLYRRREALEVLQQGRASLYLSASNTFAPWDPQMGHDLLALFGQTQEDREYERIAKSPEIAARAAEPAEFQTGPPSLWRRFHALSAVALTIAAALAWGPVTHWMINAQAGAPLLACTLLIFVLACFVALGFVEVWWLFVSNRIIGLTVDESGITLRKRRGERRIEADAILGVEVRRARAGGGPDIHIHIDRARDLHLQEVAWDVKPGELAGVLMHRFGEWDPQAACRR